MWVTLPKKKTTPPAPAGFSCQLLLREGWSFTSPSLSHAAMIGLAGSCASLMQVAQLLGVLSCKGGVQRAAFHSTPPNLLALAPFLFPLLRCSLSLREIDRDALLKAEHLFSAATYSEHLLSFIRLRTIAYYKKKLP